MEKPKKKKISGKYESYENVNEEEFKNIQDFYGVPNELRKLLFVRSKVGEKAGRKVLLVSEGVRRFLEADNNQKVKLVNMGCQVLEKGKESFAGHECLYRLCQDGIHFILDHLHSRKLKVPLTFFKTILILKSVPHDHIEDQDIRGAIQSITQGSFCIYIDEFIDGNRVVDAVVGQNFKNSFHLMVSN
jgi:hypothetical protein